MDTKFQWALALVAALALPASTTVAEEGFGRLGFGKGGHDLVSPRICKRLHLSEETQRWCDSIVGLRGRDLYKATVLENLRRINRPPVAELRLARLLGERTVLPGRVDLHAGESTDEDGFVAYYDFQLFDADTGMPLGSVKTTRKPVATMRVHGGLPPNLLGAVTVTDDEGATDTTELAFTSDGIVQDLPEAAAKETER
jgi:hypothetical protein